MSKTVIREEDPGDEAAIEAVHHSSFPSPAEALLVHLLRSAGRLTFSMVAEVEGNIVGHVGFSPVTTADGRTGVGLAPVAVRADHRQRGIAEEMIRTGLQRCQATGWGWCVVLGDPAYYARFNFRPAVTFGLSDEYNGGDAFQVLELLPGSMPVGAGLVRYAPEFASLGD
jgi:putative acetyltransferase